MYPLLVLVLSDLYACIKLYIESKLLGWTSIALLNINSLLICLLL